MYGNFAVKKLNWTKKKKLGSGAFGTVYEGELRGKCVAVKVLKKANFNADLQKEFENEIAAMTKNLHPNVVMMMGISMDNGEGKDKGHERNADEEEGPMLVMELMRRGSVFHLLHRTNTPLSFHQRMKFAKACALGMNMLHCGNPPFLHLDLKSQNLLVDSNWVVKVADFGQARMHGLHKAGMDQFGPTGTLQYMAPEVLDSEEPDVKADVYSFGILLWELFTRKIPYTDEKEAFSKEPGLAIAMYRHVVEFQRRLNIPENCPKKLKDLITACWHPDKAQRPFFKDIIESRILDEVILQGIFSDANSAARTFWKQYFLGKEDIEEVIAWKTFWKKLKSFCGLNEGNKPDIRAKALKVMLMRKGETQVTLQRFADIIEWFGPFRPDSSFIDNVLNAINTEGFFGDEPLPSMKGMEVGSYLVRFSGQRPGFYTIASITRNPGTQNNILMEYRIMHRAGTKYVWEAQPKQSYDSLAHVISSKAKEWNLQFPMDRKGTRYASVLDQSAQLDHSYFYTVSGGPLSYIALPASNALTST
jgi:serine/threonine protein kinase